MLLAARSVRFHCLVCPSEAAGKKRAREDGEGERPPDDVILLGADLLSDTATSHDDPTGTSVFVNFTSRVSTNDLALLNGVRAAINSAASIATSRDESRTLDDLFLLSSRIVDAITRSRSAAPLGYLNIANCAEGPESPLRAADMLRLLQGCPALGHLNWFVDSAYQEYAGLDRGTCQAIVDLLESRGTTIDQSYFEQLDAGETPWCIVECE